MAEGKKSFTAYCDWGDVVDKMTDEQAGKLMKHLFDYVRDKNPSTDDMLTDIAFTPIKATLKRDLKKWEEKCAINKENGSKGGRPKNPEKPNGYLENPVKPKKPDSDRDSDIINTTDEIKNIDVDTDNTPHFKEQLKADLNKYEEEIFLKNWSTCREHYLQQPTHIVKLNFQEKTSFKDALKDFTKEDINTAMYGLFKQENIEFQSMLLRPKHFLERIDVYYAAEKSKNYQLYGSKKVVQ